MNDSSNKASEGEVDRLPLLMAKQACDLIRTLCIVELHIPKADARLDQISDTVDLLRGHLNALTPSAGASGQDALPQSVLTALGNMKAQMPSEYAQVIQDKFWELTGPSDSIPARGVTVTEEMVERALAAIPHLLGEDPEGL